MGDLPWQNSLALYRKPPEPCGSCFETCNGFIGGKAGGGEELGIESAASR